MKKYTTKNQFTNNAKMKDLNEDFILICKPNHISVDNRKYSSEKVKNVFVQLIEEVTCNKWIDRATADDLRFIIEDYLDNIAYNFYS